MQFHVTSKQLRFFFSVSLINREISYQIDKERDKTQDSLNVEEIAPRIQTIISKSLAGVQLNVEYAVGK